MIKKIVTPGQKYQNLTVLYSVGSKNGKKYWKCLCDCGNYTQIPTGKLGVTKSCGCLKNNHSIEDLTNKHFGRLIVLEVAGRDKNNKIQWLCQCQCGKTTVVRANDLKQGKVLSCGCLRKKHLAEGYKLYNQYREPTYYKDLKGLKFGKLTVLSYEKQISIEKNKNKITNKRAYWKCQCDCGNIIYVASSNLINGHTQSCGCLVSKGQQKIKQLLQENNINFETQKTFEDCILPSGQKARFDFYVDNKYLIEFDGQQHFLDKQASPKSYYNNQKIQKIKQSDQIKNKWAEQHNILLIRIPYYKYSTLTIDDLLCL